MALKLSRAFPGIRCTLRGAGRLGCTAVGNDAICFFKGAMRPRAGDLPAPRIRRNWRGVYHRGASRGKTATRNGSEKRKPEKATRRGNQKRKTIRGGVNFPFDRRSGNGSSGRRRTRTVNLSCSRKEKNPPQKSKPQKFKPGKLKPQIDANEHKWGQMGADFKKGGFCGDGYAGFLGTGTGGDGHRRSDRRYKKPQAMLFRKMC